MGRWSSSAIWAASSQPEHRSDDHGPQIRRGFADRRIKETQEMFDFCGKHGIVSDIEVIKMRTSTKPTSGC